MQRSLLSKWATPALSLALLLAILWHLRDVHLKQSLPAGWTFYAALLGYWMMPILSDYVVYRGLWSIPAEGLIALARKQVGNVLLFDLLGESYFYGWARKKVAMATSPFGAIKDVTLLSALVGNLVTLTLFALIWPNLPSGIVGAGGYALGASIVTVCLLSIGITVLGPRIFSLPRWQMFWIAAVHLARVIAMMWLMALALSLAMPSQDPQIFLLLSAMQVMFARLPLFVNADVAFANVVIWMFGPDGDVQQTVAMVTVLGLIFHLGMAGVLAVGDLVTPYRGKPS
ncbi:MAG: hypothetical protein K2X68_13180 [Novosphingobium sp.]|nr:hypothetical protein [Novosphingobium sp.]